MCTCIELPFEALCQSCVEELNAGLLAQVATIEDDSFFQPSEDELPF